MWQLVVERLRAVVILREVRKAGCYYPVHRTFYYVHPITLLFCTPLSYFVIGRLFRVRLPISQITNLRAEIKLFPSLH